MPNREIARIPIAAAAILALAAAGDAYDYADADGCAYTECGRLRN